jgi:hypothetical protein
MLTVKAAINKFTELTDWRGTAWELAEVVSDVLETFGMEKDPIPTERLVRYYVTAGVLTRPEKEGREAYFGFRQIVEFLAVRVLLDDGWTLARIADFFRTAAMDALLSLLPESVEVSMPVSSAAPIPPRTKAEKLVEQFAGPARRLHTVPSIAPETIAPPQAVQRRAQIKQEVKSALRRLDVDADMPPRTSEVRVTLAPWCHLSIAPDTLDEALRRIPDSTEQERLVEDLTRVCRAAIEEEVTRRRR